MSETPSDPQAEAQDTPSSGAASSAESQSQTEPQATPDQGDAQPVRRPIKIGSQRPGHDEIIRAKRTLSGPPPQFTQPEPKPAAPVAKQPAKPKRPAAPPENVEEPDEEATASVPATPAPAEPAAPPEPAKHFPPPRLERVSPELQREIDDALGDASIEQLLAAETGGGKPGEEIELDERRKAKVVKIDEENVFFLLGGQYEGFAPLRQFAKPPELNEMLEVVPVRFNQEEGLYEVTVPGAAIDVGDWADIEEGIVVEANVTGSNTGGLECKVGNLRGFIPASQVALFHIDDFSDYVGKKLACVVTEANPERRNLVLSHRAVLEREREESRQKTLEALEVGSVVEGVVRNVRDFGAFVDLGGVDGLVHVSKLSWDRVNHPSDVVKEGERVKVKVERIDPATGKISLSIRDTLAQPWDNAAGKYHVGAIVTGTVSKITDFGAFVRLEPGIEGLVHISEIAHHRVVRVSTHLQEGQEVQVKVLSIDPEAQRMSLSIKALSLAPQAAGKKKSEEDDDLPPREMAVPERKGALKGGTNKKTGGESFGLNW